MYTDDRMKEILLDDELIHDYQFGEMIYMTGLIEDMKEFTGNRSFIFSGFY